MRIDLHTHSTISDGTDAPAALVDRARAVGLDVVALTDHDTFAGLDEAATRGEQVGVQVVRGMELSCTRVGQSVHLLAYGADPDSPALAAELEKVRGGRMGRLSGVLARLAELGVPVTEEQVLAEVGESPSVGRPHIADAMVKAGHVADRTEAFDRFLADGGPAHVPRYAIPVERGIELVHEDHDADPRARLPPLAGELGLLATGSSDYHGTGKLDHELGCNTTDPDVYEALMDRLAERQGTSALGQLSWP